MLLPSVTKLSGSTELRSHHLATSDPPTDSSHVSQSLTNHREPQSLLSPPPLQAAARPHRVDIRSY